MQERYFSDEELVAYLDGEEDHAPVAEIVSAMKTDTKLVKRLDSLRLDTSEIAESFGAIKMGEMPELPLAPSANDNSYGFRNAVAASIIAVAIGFGAGISVPQSKPDWRDYVASYQALYINSTLEDVNVPEAIKQSDLTRVASAIGKDIKVENLDILSEVEYKRSQILGYEGKPLIQIAFLDSMGQPIALCIIRSEEGKKLNMELDTMEGMSSAAWSNDGYEYILIGGQDQSLISRMASQFSSTI